MLQLTYDDSAGKAVNYTERHMHLCEQTPGGQKYAAAIKPAKDELEIRQKTREKADKEVTFATDRVNLKDLLLDYELKKVHTRCSEYDKENPGSNVREMIFPGGLLTPVVTLPLKKEPGEVEKLLQRIEALGAQHPLYALAATVYPYVNDCHESLADREELMKTAGKAHTDEDIAKMALVRQYNANYFAAAHDVDKSFAERLFPKVKQTRKKNEDDDTEEELPNA